MGDAPFWGCRLQAPHIPELLGEMLTARAPPSRTSLPGQIPTIPGPVCFLSHPAVSSKPALGKTSQRLRSAHVAGPPSPQD